jgi:PhnB protein
MCSHGRIGEHGFPARRFAMVVQPYIFFDGRCEEAIEFYRKALGAEVKMLARFKDAPPGGDMGAPPDKIMHATLRIGDSEVMFSDGHCTGKPVFSGFSLSATVRDDAEAKRVFDALADGGHVQMPLGKTFFSTSFGMVSDRFGMGWMIYVGP